MNKPSVYAIIPARSGSKGIPDKNIKLLAGKPLFAYSIEFANKLGVDKVICSTDSEEYATLAKSYGAEVPFLRSKQAASDTAMEQDILVDLYDKFSAHNIPMPKYLVWLRPTFVFRDKQKIWACIDQLEADDTLSSSRTVCKSESRLYSGQNGILHPRFDDGNKSMIRRQDVESLFKVYSTDIIRASVDNTGDDFLGRKVAYVEINETCGLDIDTEIDFAFIEYLIKHKSDLVSEYL
jgi:CMP-N-acetylneuraminic acid synthetase